MIAPAITRMLKLDPLIRTIAGGVSVDDTKCSVPNTVTHLSNRLAKSRKCVSRLAIAVFLRYEFVSSRSRLPDERFRRTHTKTLFRPMLSSIKLHEGSQNMAKKLFGTD